MSAARTDRRVWLLAGALLVAVAAWASLDAGLSGDYGHPACFNWNCDDPSRSLHALVSGDIATFFRTQSLMGLTSILLRAPAVAIVHAWGGNLLGEYRAGALVCLVATALIGTWIARHAQRRGATLPAALCFLLLWGIAAIGSRALFFGHPEEPLAAALLLLAFVLACDGRGWAAGIALGLAIGTKEWALIGAPLLLVSAAPADWRRIAVGGVLLVALTIGVNAAGNPSSFKSAHQAARRSDRQAVTPANVWFRTGHRRIAARLPDGRYAYAVFPPKLLGRWIRPFVLLLGVLAAAMFALRFGRGPRFALGLVAALLLARVVLDTQTFSYHLVPMLMAITTWEAVERRRFPVVGAAAMVAFQLTVHQLVPNVSANTFNAVFCAWTLPLLAYLTLATFRRSSAAARA